MPVGGRVSLLPADLRALARQRQGHIYLSDDRSECARLAELGIQPGSEFHTLFSTLVMANMTSPHSLESLSPIVDSDGETAPGILFAWEVWEVPRRYVAITSLEGEGGYFFDRESGAIVDFELAHRESFMAGDIRQVAASAFEFMRWYLSEGGEPRGYAAV